MKLTRKVLIEKQSEFWRYSTTDDISEELWEKLAHEIILNIKTHKEFCDFIMEKILCPLLKVSGYHVGENIYTPNNPHRKIELRRKNGKLCEIIILNSVIEIIKMVPFPDTYLQGFIEVCFKSLHYQIHEK